MLGLTMILIRRNVPESPRWLFIHGREDEAEAIVDEIERTIVAQTGATLEEPGESISVRQRTVIPFREIASVAFGRYPRRATLGLALFVGQAFIYNAITFDLGTILATFFKVGNAIVPYFILLFAAGNFFGPLTLGRLFDTVGRKPMISFTYIASAAVAIALGILLVDGTLDRWSFIALVGVTFFLASAGASSAYLTVSEIFPMETRALSIAFFYAVGTGIGGITGPLLFGNFINSGKISEVALGFFIGAAVMAIGGIAELVLGVPAEQRSLEDIATPITAQDADRGTDADRATGSDRGAEPRRSRLRPGPGSQRWLPGMSMPAQAPFVSYQREMDWIVDAVRDRGVVDRVELERVLGGRWWGPGRFSAALRLAVRDGLLRRVGRTSYTTPDRRDERSSAPRSGPRPAGA